MCCSWVILASPPLYKHGKAGVACAVPFHLVDKEYDAQRSEGTCAREMQENELSSLAFWWSH